MEVDHELAEVGEFDALAIEIKLPAIETKPPAIATKPPAIGTKLPRPALDATDDVACRVEGGKPGKYPAKEHAKKVARELRVDGGLIYLLGLETQLYEDSDMGPEFRQRRYFYYLSGADIADCVATYDIADDELILWIPHIDPRQLLWTGRPPSIAECKDRSDLDDVRYTAGLRGYLRRRLQRPRAVLYALHPDQVPSPAGAERVDTAHLRPAMDAARVVKTGHEVALIRRANAVSSAAHRAVLEHLRLRLLASERDVEAVFRAACLARGAKHQAYAPIAGSGANAACLHYGDNDQPLAGRHLLVLDAGCEWACYASDITRTLPLGPAAPDPRAAAVYAVVERMQEECIAAVRPGLVFYALHLRAAAVAAAGLLRLGVLRGAAPARLVARGTVAAFFPHGLGHHLGLECHDTSGREPLMLPAAAAPRGPRRARREWVSPEMLAALCRDAAAVPPPYKGRQKLVKNMVVTVEPGIYFCREYIEAYFLSDPAHAEYINKDVLEEYYPIGGVRIEDDILVTEDGHENLTTAPKGEEALRIIYGETSGGDAAR